MRGCTCTGALDVYCEWCTALLALTKRTRAYIGERQPTLPQVAPTAHNERIDTQELTWEPGDGKNTDIAEATFQARVLRLAAQHGWLVYYIRDSRGSPEGYPDLTLTNGQDVLFCELKSRQGKLRPEQARWLALLAHAGAECHVWRPADWPEIHACLTQHQGAPHE